MGSRNKMKRYDLCILYSGGIDSLTAFYYALKKYKMDMSNILLLIINYGQPYFEKEYNLFKKLRDTMERENALYANNEIAHNFVEKIHYRVLKIDIEDESDVKNHITANRNTIFTSIACRFSDEVWLVANNDEVHVNDKSYNFFEYVNKLNALTMERPILIKSPFINWSRTKIIEWGLNNNVPYFYSSSCYDSKSMACGKCSGCFHRYFDMVYNDVYEKFDIDVLDYEPNIERLKIIWRNRNSGNLDIIRKYTKEQFKKYNDALGMTEKGRKIRNVLFKEKANY